MSATATTAAKPTEREQPQPAANDNERAIMVEARTKARSSGTREPAHASTDFADVLRGLVREIVREELAIARPAASEADAHLSAPAAARYAGVATGTIRRWIHDGKLRELRAGRHLRVRRTDLDAMLRGDRNTGPDSSPEELARQAFGG